MQPNGFITLTTDFGLSDAYVAVLRGVILSINPAARPVDYTHEVAPQHISQAAYLLQTGYGYFPPGTVHLVVVDPGVGSARKAIVLVTPEAAFVAPDNGVLTYIWQESLLRWGRAALRLIELNEPRWWLSTVSTTFHGRDLFAPVAAHLSAGVAATELGTALDEPVLLPLAAPIQRSADTWDGRIIHIDNFGNCITNLTRSFLAGLPSTNPVLSILDQRLDKLHRIYGDAEPGELIALISSSDRLEIAVRNGHAARMLGVCVGDLVRLTL